MKIIKKIYSKIRHSIELGRYNDFTIAEYFRKQGAQIGENNRIEVRSLGTEPFLVKIGDHCTIAPNVVFLTHAGAPWIFTEEHPGLQGFGTITILDNCFIGLNSVIIGTVKIGPNSIVGAGSIVTRDVPPGVVAAGNPARVISTVEDYKKKVLGVWEKQRPPEYFRGLESGVAYPPSLIHEMKKRDWQILKDHLVKLFWGQRP